MPIAINALSKKTGAARHEIRKWISDAGCGYEDEAKCVEVIHSHQTRTRKQPDDRDIDPESGLSWYKANLKEQALERRQRNAEKALELSKDWVKTEYVLNLVRGLCNKLDQIPLKAKSQFSLSDLQKQGVQKMIDDVRKEYADGL